MWDASVPSGQHPVKLQSTKFKYKNTHYKNSENIQVFYIGLKINFGVRFQKGFTAKAYLTIVLEHHPADKSLQTVTSQVEELHKSEIKIQLITYLFNFFYIRWCISLRLLKECCFQCNCLHHFQSPIFFW